MKSVGIVGGGISGLVAAWQLAHSAPDVRITVFEAGDRPGGKLRQESVAGHQVDVGAESALWRRPEVADLLKELGVTAVHPQRYPAMLWSRGRLEALPPGTLMGIPADPGSAAGLLTPEEVTRAQDERAVALEPDGDVTVGVAVETALGAAVVDRMVEPLLGGVYAGSARNLSARACVPALYRALAEGIPLTTAAAASSSAVSSNDPRAVFGAPDGGMGALPALLATALQERGVDVITGAEVLDVKRSLGHRGTWHLEVEIDGLTEPREVDGVIVATPAPVAARLLAAVAPTAAGELAEVECASMAIVTYAFPARVGEVLPEGTGFLVPPVDGHVIKASTFSSVKWPWLADAVPDVVYVRVSMGRHGESDVLDRSDGDLVALGLRDLSAALGADLPEPLDSQVQRWRDGLPQYVLGHVDRMACVKEAIAVLPAFEVIGAAVDGVGIPACVATARAAALGVLADLS